MSLSILRTVAMIVLLTSVGAAATANSASPRVVELEVRGGRLASGPQVIRLKRDEAVSLTVRADKSDELHLHGYNLHLHLSPEQPATLKFVAKRTGRFSFELHKAGTELGVFEIYPK